jgi:hypothetical protein
MMEDDFARGRGPRSAIRLIFNIFALGFLLATVCVGGAYGMIFFDPQVGFNPFPPPTFVPTVAIPITPTAAATLPPVWTPTPSSTPRSTDAPPVTLTPSPTATETTTAVAQVGGQFSLQDGSPAYITDPRGCEVMGIGGRLFDTSGGPENNWVVRVGGTLDAQDLGIIDTISGSSLPAGADIPQLGEPGEGGYYIQLADEPIASENSVWIEIVDPASGLRLSNRVFLFTLETCAENLILVNWILVEE